MGARRSIEELKRIFPMPDLLAKLGYADRVKTSAKCMLHEDGRNSFSVFRGEDGSWRAKCHAGCFSGDELDLVEAFFSLDTKQAIARYADLAGGFIYTEAVAKFNGKLLPAKVVKEPKPIAPAKLEPLSPAAAAKIAQWRGLEDSTLLELSKKGIFGLYDSKPAFVAVSGVHYRWPDGSWRYSMGAKTCLLHLNANPIRWSPLYVVESNWDALALFESSPKDTVLCTRGAANARMAIEYINKLNCGESMKVTCIPHNDKPGEDWANDLRAGLMLHDFQVKCVPAPFKDFAELWKARPLQ